MVEEIPFENDQISNFDSLMTLSLDRVIQHTIVHHSLTFTYLQIFIEIEETFCGLTDIRTDGRTSETGFIRST